MIEYLYIILGGIFGGVNLFILYSDIYHKKIPNRSLGVLLGMFVLFLFLDLITGTGAIDIHTSLFFTIIVSFILFYYNIWSAGDAKYLIVLSLFLSEGSIIYFIGNIALITLGFLFFSTLYIYFIKSIIDKKYCYDLWSKVYDDLKDKVYIFFTRENKVITPLSIAKKIFPLLLGFLIVFTAIRLIRIYLVNSYIENISESGEAGRTGYFIELITEHSAYIIIAFITLIYITYKGLRYCFSTLLPKFCKYLGISEKSGQITMLGLVSAMLIIFIISEFFQDPEFIKTSLIRIFTFYICLWLAIKIILYMHYITFQLGEVVYKPISKLQKGDIIDIPYLKELFGTQKCLGYKQEKGKYAPDPNQYFESIINPVNKKTSYELKNIYKLVNEYHKKAKTPGFEKIEAIKTLKSFAFAPHIFLGFVISFFYENTIITILVGKILGLLLGE